MLTYLWMHMRSWHRKNRIAATLAYFCCAVIFLPVTANNPAPQTQGDSDAPYPPSTAIVNLSWAPASTIQRAAQGSDNFPLTWADDDYLYTSYGDGRGFDQAASQKLSLGYARVAGPPGDFVGTNISSPDEKVGDGRTGEKASGMLMVDSVLYMWVRNADNNGQGCRLARSTDYAQTWTWSDWTFPQFGYCTFINYGQNYAGARDDYVYMVTHDLPNAYRGTRDFVLTRVPKTDIMARDAYEFFVGLDASNQPTWTADIAQRGAVFSYPDDRARRSGISYNAGLGRYLWWQGFPHSGDERLEGGFGVYDAPEPWGPWTTVYYTNDWDVGPGETGSFPTKWMSADGTEIHLVFSGNDAFSVRKATLTLAGTPTPTSRAGGEGTPTPPVTSTPSGDSCLDGYYVESGGNVVIEVEQFSDVLSGSGTAAGNAWEPVSTFSNAVGTAMQALPNGDVNTNLNTNGPALLYDVEFQTAGTYYVFVRGLAPAPEPTRNDSLHVGLNDDPVTTDRGTGLTGFAEFDTFSWQNDANAGERTRLTIPAPGRYFINVWMREDGVVVDRLWLSTNPDAVAGGSTSPGPAASVCVGVEQPDTSTPTPTDETTTPSPSSTSQPSATPTATPTRSSTVDTATPTETNAATPTDDTPTASVTATPTTTTPTTTTPTTTTPTTTPTSIHCPPGTAFGERNGQVVMEAEHFTDRMAGSGNAASHTWQEALDVAGAVGGAAMQALPNANVNTGLNTTGPLLTYEIEFEETDTYYVYVRGMAPRPSARSNDSVHVGLNTVAATAERGTGLTGFGGQSGLVWHNDANGGQDTRVLVSSPGRHTFALWMREDGVIVDRIWLSTAQNAIKNGSSAMGPAESDCVAGGGSPSATPLPSDTPAATGTPLATTPTTKTPTPSETPTPTQAATAIPTASSTAAVQTVQVRVAHPADDAEEKGNGSVSLYSRDVEMTEDNGVPQTVGLRFENVPIPQAATIHAARLHFVSANSLSGPTSLQIWAEDGGNASAFSKRNGDVSARGRTATSVAWSALPAWRRGQTYSSPDIAAVVQHVVHRQDWQRGNALAIIITGTGRRAAVSFDEQPGVASRLVVEFTVP